ncbi:MAG: hypothetical protein IKY94_15220 [Lachnospiraceae bacterium]|nr:hypothetical protein [Lachnospiraceae bacterium]
MEINSKSAADSALNSRDIAVGMSEVLDKYQNSVKKAKLENYDWAFAI